VADQPVTTTEAVKRPKSEDNKDVQSDSTGLNSNAVQDSTNTVEDDVLLFGDYGSDED
jgi:hypothetical protein